MRVLTLALLLALPAAADEGVRFPGGGGGGVAATLVCLLTGGANCVMADDVRFTGASAGTCFEDVDQCLDSDGAGGYEFRDELGNVTLTLSTAGVVTFTGQSIYSGVTTDVTTGTNEDLVLAPNGTGSVVLRGGDSTVELQESGGTQRGSLLISSTNLLIQATVALILGSTANRATNAVAVSLRDNNTTPLLEVYGGGLVKYAAEQTATCSLGALALDPTSSQISIDANAAACAVTLAETTGTVVGPGAVATITVFNVGAGVVTFPDVANIFEGPALCTNTGIGANGTMSIMYANRADDLWIATGCQAP